MKKRTFLILAAAVMLMLGFAVICQAAEGDSLWSHTYGGSNDEQANSVIQTSDGGYLLAGSTQSFGAGYQDMYLVKTDSDGDTLWTRTYGGGYSDRASSVIQTPEGGYLLAGETQDFGTWYDDMYLVKTDSDGDTLWTRTYGGLDHDWASSVIQTPEGGYLLAGGTQSFGAGSTDMYLVKTDSDGGILWTRTYGGVSYDGASSVIQTSEGGYLLAGGTYSFGAGYDDMYLVKTNAAGNTLLMRTYGGLYSDGASSLIQTPEDGYLLAGGTESFGAGAQDMWLVKVDAAGDSLWTHTYGGTGDDRAYSIIPSGDGNFLLAGYTCSFGAGYADMWLVKVDSQGDSLWSHTYGGDLTDLAAAIIPSPSGDGNFLLAGGTYSFGAGACDMWLVCVEGLQPHIDVSPNPLNFGYVQMGMESTLPLFITNTGQGMLELDSITISDPAFYANMPYTELDPGDSLSLAVTFSPTQSIPYVAILSIENNDSTVQVLLVGGGIPPEGVTPVSSDEIPARFAFNAPAPNPFNPATVLSFDLPVACTVKLEVFDVHGRLVGARHASPLPSGSGATPTIYSAGAHHILFDGSNLPSGIYLAKLSAGDWSAVQKLVLLK